MIPKQTNLLDNIGNQEQPSFTYWMDTRENKVVSTCDDLSAIQQAIYKVLNTERFDCVIYSWNYGVELKDLIGMPVNYCMLEVERRIKEALLQDDRIKSVYGFQFDTSKKGIVHATFMVETVKGIITIEKGVRV